MNRIKHKSCPLCQGSFIQIYDLPHSQIGKCEQSSCGLVFAESQPSDLDLQNTYNTIYYLENDEDTTRAEKPNSDVLKFEQHFANFDNKLNLEKKTVLDYRCGIGNFLQVARKSGVSQAICVELNKRAREIAQEKGFRVEKSIDQIENASIDFVYMNDVLEHLRDPVVELEKIRRVLSAQGVLVVITLNIYGIKAILLKDKWDLVTNPTHFYFFDRKSLGKVLTAAGYGEIVFLNFYVAFGHHSVLRQIFQRILVRFKLDTSLKIMATK